MLTWRYKFEVIAFALILLAAMILSCTSAGEPQIEWSKTFGGAGYDWGHSIQQTSDGGYIILAVTGSFGAGMQDVYLIKTDKNGNEQWNKTFGDKSADRCYSIQQTSDGGYILVGDTFSYLRGMWLVKADSDGNEQWNKTFGATVGFSVQQTSDGGYIIGGYGTRWADRDDKGRDIFLIKTDKSGNEQWNKTFGGPNVDRGAIVQQTSDGGYIVLGDLDTSPRATELIEDVYLIKTDKSGNEVWSKTFGGSKRDHGVSVQQTSDGGYIILGVTESFGAENKIYLIKTDKSGNEQWSKTLVGVYGSSIQQTSDGGYIIVGGAITGGERPAIYLIKTDKSGNKQWSKTFGSPNDFGASVQQTSDGGYIILSNIDSFANQRRTSEMPKASDYDIWIVKVEGEQAPASAAKPSGEAPVEEQKSILGFEAVFAIAGLLAVAYLLRRK